MSSLGSSILAAGTSDARSVGSLLGLRLEQYREHRLELVQRPYLLAHITSLVEDIVVADSSGTLNQVVLLLRLHGRLTELKEQLSAGITGSIQQ